jgi:hypothetical protein
MSQAVEPKPEFRSLSAEAVIAALEGSDPTNPIIVEVGRLIAGYTRNFYAQVPRPTRIPHDICGIKPRSPIEYIAMGLGRAAIRETLARLRREKA